MSGLRPIDGLPGALLQRIVDRLRELEPSAGAVLVCGSYARGTARPDSDLDLTAVTRSEPVEGYRTWFEDRGAATPLHVSAGAETADERLAQRDEPAGWAFGFPVHERARYVWSEPDMVERLGDDPSVRTPPGEAEVEDFVETTAKARDASSRSDVEAARWYAHEAARYVPGLLLCCNEAPIVSTQREALAAALGMRVVPEGYRSDMAALLGLRAAADVEVTAALERVARGVLRLLREHAGAVRAQPYTAELLADGTFEQHLRL